MAIPNVGYAHTKNDVDNRAGGLTQVLRDTLASITTFNAWLAATADADLIALGYVQADINTLKSGMTDLAKLAAIFKGTQTQATTYDFMTFAKFNVGVA